MTSSGGVTWPCTAREATASPEWVLAGIREIRLSSGEMSPGGLCLSGDEPDDSGGDGWPTNELEICNGAITVWVGSPTVTAAGAAGPFRAARVGAYAEG